MAAAPPDTPAFAPGDVLIAATDVDAATLDFRKGIKGRCRILHCDAGLNLKSEVYTGEDGLLVGLAVDPQAHVLYATNPQRNSVLRYDFQGQLLPALDFLPTRRFGNLVFRQDGTAIIGVHSFHGHGIEDEHGDGKLVRFDPRKETFKFYTVEIDGGRGGKHCVSNLALSPDQQTVFYVSEAGRRVCRFSLTDEKQLPDFIVLNADDARGTYGVQVLPDGSVLLATGIGCCLFDPDGTLEMKYDIPERKGWTRAKLARDGKHFFIGNFLDGLLQKRELSTGAIVQEIDVQRKGSLTSVVEIPA